LAYQGDDDEFFGLRLTAADQTLPGGDQLNNHKKQKIFVDIWHTKFDIYINESLKQTFSKVMEEKYEKGIEMCVACIPFNGNGFGDRVCARRAARGGW
jgi:hypothetical protein